MQCGTCYRKSCAHRHLLASLPATSNACAAKEQMHAPASCQCRNAAANAKLSSSCPARVPRRTRRLSAGMRIQDPSQEKLKACLPHQEGAVAAEADQPHLWCSLSCQAAETGTASSGECSKQLVLCAMQQTLHQRDVRSSQYAMLAVITFPVLTGVELTVCQTLATSQSSQMTRCRLDTHRVHRISEVTSDVPIHAQFRMQFGKARLVRRPALTIAFYQENSILARFQLHSLPEAAMTSADVAGLD